MRDIFLAKALNGKLDFGSEANQSRLRDSVKKNEGKTYRVELMQNKRSLAQNAYYWLYLGVIARETGDDENSLHEYFRRTLLPSQIIKAINKEIKIPKSTTQLSKVEMGEYLEKICALTCVPLPDRELAGYYIEK